MRIGGDDRYVEADRLSDEHSIEWVFVEPREFCDCLNIPRSYWCESHTHQCIDACYIRIDSLLIGNDEFAGRDLDPDLPNRCETQLKRRSRIIDQLLR